LDIANRQQVAQVIGQLRPSAIVNCAAYTAVDRAEQNQDRCYAINATAVEHLAQAADHTGATLVQISSDYVFGGNAERTAPYTETDSPAPQGVYARSKLLGEQAAAACRRHIVVRTCGLYGERAKPTQANFVDTMLRLAGERPSLRVVGDQRCTPSYVCDVAEAIVLLIDQQVDGLFHVVNQGETTWYQFALRIFALAKLDIQVLQITTEEYGALAPRPRYSVLSTEKYQTLGGPKLRGWEVALADYLSKRR